MRACVRMCVRVSVYFFDSFTDLRLVLLGPSLFHYVGHSFRNGLRLQYTLGSLPLSPSSSVSLSFSLSLFLSLDVSVGEVIAFRWRRSGGPRSLGGLVCYFTPEGTFSFVFQRNMHQPQAVRKDGLISIGGVKKMMHDRIR